MQAYHVTLTHPDLEGTFEADVIASSASRAENKVRMAAFHAYRHAPLLDALTTSYPITDDEFNS